MRYAKILFLNFQQVFEERTRSFIWFLLSLYGPLLMILFWRGANTVISFSAISSYYFLLVIGGSLLMSHSEENIALIDIQEGRLGNYILKPFKYFFAKWMEEIPYRLLQSSFGVVTLILFLFVLHIHISSFVSGVFNIVITFLLIIGGIVLAQIYKTCLGFIAFWMTDAYGVFQISEMLIFVFAGYIVPLFLFPHTIEFIAYILPFSYMIYFPVAAFTGLFTLGQLVLILLGQLFWIGCFSLLYTFMWKKGLKMFTGVGQ